jgi:hypothetical protein
MCTVPHCSGHEIRLINHKLSHFVTENPIVFAEINYICNIPVGGHVAHVTTVSLRRDSFGVSARQYRHCSVTISPLRSVIFGVATWATSPPTARVYRSERNVIYVQTKEVK